MTMSFQNIGTIHTPFKNKKGTPKQSKRAGGIKGKIIMKKEFTDGLKDLNGFSHIILFFYFHESKGYRLKINPFYDNIEVGVFATRSPNRPNGIGMSVVRLTGIEDNILNIENVDILDGTPLLDIKPYIPDIDVHLVEKTGWIKKKS